MSPANKSAAAPAPSSDSPLDGPISAEERWQLMLGADEELGGLSGSLLNQIGRASCRERV